MLDANGLSWSSDHLPRQTLAIPGVAAPRPAARPAVALNAEKTANAQIIIQVGRELGVSDRGIVIALGTAMQESRLRNLNWGDRDSLGLFQQRPSTGWGTAGRGHATRARHAAVLRRPVQPERGLTRGLLDIPGWETMPLTQPRRRCRSPPSPTRTRSGSSRASPGSPRWADAPSRTGPQPG